MYHVSAQGVDERMINVHYFKAVERYFMKAPRENLSLLLQSVFQKQLLSQVSLMWHLGALHSVSQ